VGPYEVRVTGTLFDAAWDPDDQRFSLDLHDGGVTPISEHWAAGVLVEVAIHGASVWAAGEDGRLWGPDPRAPGVVDLDAWLEYAEVLDLSADEHGVWVSTTKGVFRVVR